MQWNKNGETNYDILPKMHDLQTIQLILKNNFK